MTILGEEGIRLGGICSRQCHASSSDSSQVWSSLATTGAALGSTSCREINLTCAARAGGGSTVVDDDSADVTLAGEGWSGDAALRAGGT